MEKFQLSSSATLVNSPTRSRTSTHDSASTCPMYEPVSSTEEHLSRSTKIYSRTRKSALTSSLELPVVSTLSFATSPSSVEAFVTSFSTSATRCSNPSVSQQLFKKLSVYLLHSLASLGFDIRKLFKRRWIGSASSSAHRRASSRYPSSGLGRLETLNRRNQKRLTVDYRRILLRRSCPTVSSRQIVMSHRQASSSHRWPPKFDYRQETSP